MALRLSPATGFDPFGIGKERCAVTAAGSHSHSHIATPQFLRFAIATGLKKIVAFFNSAVRFAKKYVVTPEGNRCRDIGQFGRTR